jgi:integrase
MRGEQIDTTGRVWKWCPRSHKTAHHGRTRAVYLGPRAVDLLCPWFRSSGWLFPTRSGMPYSTMSYARAIRRACDRAGIAPWGPNRLRHAAATTIRATCGLEAAQAVLGHAKIETTQVYAEVQERVATDAAMRLG